MTDAQDAPKPISPQGAKIYLTMLQGLRSTVGSELFTFIINGTPVESDLAEACFISPAAGHALEEDKFVRRFEINDEVVSPDHFALLQDLFDGREITVKKEVRKPLALLCRRLGNASLAHFFASLFTAPAAPAPTSGSAPAAAPAAPEEVKATLAQYLEKSEEKPADPGNSTEELSLLAVDEVEQRIDSGQLTFENEDALLKRILELGPEYTQLLSRIQVDKLTADGVARLAENLPYRDLNEAIWQGIVQRLRDAGQKPE
jgi:uncharacterized small protein (DUF1192 family)